MTLAALALAVLLALPALPAQDKAVDIVDDPRPQDRWGYSPVTTRVSAGSWVTWSNWGVDAHTVTASDGSFDSGELNPSEGYSWYFDTAGTFEYVCVLHPWMRGRIVVSS